MKDEIKHYSIGALLYTPANNTGIVKSVSDEKFGSKYSLALCLEDTLRTRDVAKAEVILSESVKAIYEKRQKKEFYLPKLFIRVRKPEQIDRILCSLGQSVDIVNGIIFPKSTPDNLGKYVSAFESARARYNSKISFMPILESPELIDIRRRTDFLYNINELLKKVEGDVLNVRVGGNDLCGTMGYRRHCDETIYEYGVIENILIDIISVFSGSFVISGPVWEYYNSDGWLKGLKREIVKDRQCGFVGKTVIHPNQINAVNEGYMVSRQDYEDAFSIINWDSENLVSGSIHGGRMNEYKTHLRWAKKTLLLAEYYGIKNDKAK